MCYRIVVLLLLFAGVPVANAQTTDYQTFFSTLCTDTVRAVALCARAGGGDPNVVGDISGSSESSLSPSQGLSNNGGALSASNSKSKEAREREYADDELTETALASASFGPYSLMLHGRIGKEESDRVPGLDQERGFEADYLSLEVGLDRRFSDRLVIGALLGYESFELEFNRETPAPGVVFTPQDIAGETDSDGYAFTVYGAVNIGESGYLDVSAGYIDNDYDLRRNSVFQNAGRTDAENVTTEGSTSGDQLWGSVNTGISFNQSNWTHSFNVGATYADSTIDGYTETDLTENNLNLIVSETRRSSLIGHVGFSTQVAISTATGVLLPQLRVEYEKEFLDSPDVLRARFAIAPEIAELTVNGDPPDDDYYNVSVGLLAILPNAWMPFFDFENRFGHDDLDRYRLTIGLRKGF